MVEDCVLTISVDHSFTRLTSDGYASPVERTLAVEVPVALEVLMATPAELIDLVYGFALGERLIDTGADILDSDAQAIPAGWIVRATLAPRVADRVYDRVRHRTTDSACGLCGVENLEQALRPLPRVPLWTGEPAVAFAAAAALLEWQPLGRATRAVHGAARCAPDGTILEVREDVGRHNAFDKLIGAMLRADENWNGGFALLTSRCSYELVEKAALSGCPMLATISAPTDLAVRRAREAGLALQVVVRADALLSAQ
jgi:FdhD protein